MSTNKIEYAHLEFETGDENITSEGTIIEKDTGSYRIEWVWSGDSDDYNYDEISNETAHEIIDMAALRGRNLEWELLGVSSSFRLLSCLGREDLPAALWEAEDEWSDRGEDEDEWSDRGEDEDEWSDREEEDEWVGSESE